MAYISEFQKIHQNKVFISLGQRLLAELYCFWLVRLSVCCRGHSNLVIFNRISSKFHIWMARSNSHSSSNTSFKQVYRYHKLHTKIYVNSKLDLSLSCAEDFQYLSSMET